MSDARERFRSWLGGKPRLTPEQLRESDPGYDLRPSFPKPGSVREAEARGFKLHEPGYQNLPEFWPDNRPKIRYHRDEPDARKKLLEALKSSGSAQAYSGGGEVRGFSGGGAKGIIKKGALSLLDYFAKGKPRTVKIPGKGEMPAAPIKELDEAAEKYMRERGLSYENPLRPAILYDGKVYPAPSGSRSHFDALDAMPPELRARAMADGDTRGYTAPGRRFLDRDRGQAYAIKEDLIDPNAPAWARQDSAQLIAENLKPSISHRVGEYPAFDEERAKRIAEAFEAMKHSPQDPAVRRSYDALISETLDQYNSMKDAGIDVRFLKEGQSDPYAASPALGYSDLLENGRLVTFPTDFGFGSSVAFDPSDNPLLKRVGKIGDKADATANDAFRVVHDSFGHFGPGNPFFRHQGEERAWLNHQRMYSPEALPAMTSETRGQNSWLNFGPYAEHNRTASGADTVYADQKIGILPEFAWTEKAEGGLIHRMSNDNGGARNTLTPDQEWWLQFQTPGALRSMRNDEIEAERRRRGEGDSPSKPGNDNSRLRALADGGAVQAPTRMQLMHWLNGVTPRDYVPKRRYTFEEAVTEAPTMQVADWFGDLGGWNDRGPGPSPLSPSPDRPQAAGPGAMLPSDGLQAARSGALAAIRGEKVVTPSPEPNAYERVAGAIAGEGPRDGLRRRLAREVLGSDGAESMPFHPVSETLGTVPRFAQAAEEGDVLGMGAEALGVAGVGALGGLGRAALRKAAGKGVGVVGGLSLAATPSDAEAMFLGRRALLAPIEALRRSEIARGRAIGQRGNFSDNLQRHAWEVNGTGFTRAGDPFWEIPDNRSQIIQPRAGSRRPLEDIIDHPELFENYPGFKGTPVDVVPSNGGRLGEFRRDNGSIMVGSDLSPDRFHSTLLHEIQHKVQKEEGWKGYGASPSQFDNVRQIEYELQRALNQQTIKDLIIAGRLQNGGDFMRLKRDGLIPDDAKLTDFIDAANADPKELEARVMALFRENKKWGGDPLTAYRLDEGESQARNTERRFGRDADARRQSFWKETEDLPGMNRHYPVAGGTERLFVPFQTGGVVPKVAKVLKGALDSVARKAPETGSGPAAPAVKKPLDAPFPQYGERYPDIAPPVWNTKDAKPGKDGFWQKGETPETRAFMKARQDAQKAMKRDGYEPAFDPAKREDVDPSHYPTDVVTLTDSVAKKQATRDAHEAVSMSPGALSRLDEAFQRGLTMPDAENWYYMKQLEEKFIAKYGPELGRRLFAEKFAGSMAATTGGANPTGNFLTAMYANHLKTAGKDYPQAAWDSPPAIGGRFFMGNMEQHEKAFGRSPVAFDAENPKRHNFQFNFLGHRNKGTVDERMSGLIKPGMAVPPPGNYGSYEKPVHVLAERNRVDPRFFQEVGWAGAAPNETPMPMIGHVNEAIERTRRLTGKDREEIIERGIMESQIPLYKKGGQVDARAKMRAYLKGGAVTAPPRPQA